MKRICAWLLIQFVQPAALRAQSSDGAMFRINLRRTGVYQTQGLNKRGRLRFKTGGEVISSPAIVAGVVYFGSADGHIYAVDARSGKKKWEV